MRERRGLARVVVGAALTASLASPSVAQRSDANWRHAAVDAGEQGCEFCHQPHTESRGPYALRADGPSGQVRVWLETQAPGVGTVSAACLRCHWTETTRRQQGAPGVVRASEGRFLGPDLRDDHLLGTTDPSVLRARDPRRSVRRPRVMADREVMECTMCHDPHVAGALPARGAEQARRCGGCHTLEQAGLRRHGVVACSACHRMHGATQSAHLREATVELLCLRCHAGPGSPPPALARVEATAVLPLTLSPAHNPGTDCRECHSVHR